LNSSLERWQSAVHINFDRNSLGKVFKPKDEKTVMLFSAILFVSDKLAQKECVYIRGDQNRLELLSRTINIMDDCADEELVSLASGFFNIQVTESELRIDKEKFPFKTQSLDSDILFTTIKDSKVRPLQPGDVCQKVSVDCLPEINLCFFCPSKSIHYRVASNCQKNYIRKYCGYRICGEKGNPACIRGRKASEFYEHYCINDSPLGFCKPGLRVVCEDGELWCR
jgi:hypothetical protein